jgi:hypothetical protein
MCFVVLLYWAATRHGVAPQWEKRQHLCNLTGFDFWSADGCAAARSFAAGRLGSDVVEALDEVAFRARSIENTALLENYLWELWTAWCSHPSETNPDTKTSARKQQR